MSISPVALGRVKAHSFAEVTALDAALPDVLMALASCDKDGRSRRDRCEPGARKRKNGGVGRCFAKMANTGRPRGGGRLGFASPMTILDVSG